jgi:lipid A 3-O-deacylase
LRPQLERHTKLALAAALGLLIWLGGPIVRAEERLQEEALRGRWLFAPGRIELGALTGGGFGISQESTQLFALAARFGYVVAQQDVFLPGSFEIVGEPSYFAVFEGRTAHGGELSALLKYNFWTGTKFTPYFLGGGGLSYASIRVPHDGTNFNFTLQAGVGFHYALSQHSTLNFEYRFHHFSNGDISPPNPSLNTNSFFIGFSRLY